MVDRAAHEVGIEGFEATLAGPNAFIYADDPIVGPKEIAKFAKKNPKVVIKGGIVEGKAVSADDVKTIAKLPGREGLLSMLCSVLQAPVRNFACAVKAVADKQQAISDMQGMINTYSSLFNSQLQQQAYGSCFLQVILQSSVLPRYTWGQLQYRRFQTTRYRYPSKAQYHS